MKKIALALAIMLFAAYARAQLTPVYYGLTGLIQSPTGGGFNGTLSVMLARPTAVNMCSSPVGIVSQKEAIYTITNGVIVNGTSAKFLNNDCLQPAVPYFAKMFDTAHNQVYADNWFFPRMNVVNVDVGTLSDVGFGALSGGGQSTTGTNSTATPIVVAIPSAIVANPSGQQTVTQPGGTSLIVNNLSVTGTFSSTNAIAASITGNSATATALATSPTQCSIGNYATGISAAGNANCSNAFPANTSFGNLQITGAASTYASQGTFLNWGIGTTGDTDFVNVKGAGAGGWNFYNIAISGTPTVPVASLSGLGSWTATSFIGPLTGAVTGNSTTATALAATPTQCPGGQFATGVAANGNANCTAIGGTARTCNANGCYTVAADGTMEQWGNSADLGGGTLFVNFPIGFPSACQTVVISTVSMIDRISYLSSASGSVPCSTVGFTAGSNGTSSSVSWIAKGF